jgi:LPS export ABC transporter protein LptC
MILVICSLLFFAASCTFDYGQNETPDADQPDIVMQNVEYVRVRSSDPLARFKAEQAERYEELGVMRLRNFSFEQFGNAGKDVNAYGRAGSAEAEIDSGNISMDDGVRIEVASEDIIIETQQLEWKDKERLLLGGETNAVNIVQSSGTGFSGIGFRADARQRTWEFSGGVSGTYIHEDEEEESETGSVTETGAEPEPDAEEIVE